MSGKLRLLYQLLERIRVKRYSIRTEEYIHWVRRFALFHDKQYPEITGTQKVRVLFFSPGCRVRCLSGYTKLILFAAVTGWLMFARVVLRG